MSQLLGCNNQILVVECTVQRSLRTGWYIGLISFSGRSRWREAEIEMTLRVSLCQVRSSVWSVGVSIRRQREIIGEMPLSVELYCSSQCFPPRSVDCHQSHQIHIWTRGGSELKPSAAKKPSLANTRCSSQEMTKTLQTKTGKTFLTKTSGTCQTKVKLLPQPSVSNQKNTQHEFLESRSRI